MSANEKDAGARGVRCDKHSLDFFGFCPDCSAAGTVPRCNCDRQRHGFLHQDSCPENAVQYAKGLEAEIAALRARVEELERDGPLLVKTASFVQVRELTARVKRLETLVGILNLGSNYCEHFHHGMRDRHEIGDPCPIEERLRIARRALEGGEVIEKEKPASAGPVLTLPTDHCAHPNCWLPRSATIHRQMMDTGAHPFQEPTKGPILTRGQFTVLIDYFDGTTKDVDRIFAHDAVLRAEVEMWKGRALAPCKCGAYELPEHNPQCPVGAVERLIVLGSVEKARADKAEARVTELLQIIKDAPHGYMCRSTTTVRLEDDGSCDCWKRAALEGK